MRPLPSPTERAAERTSHSSVALHHFLSCLGKEKKKKTNKTILNISESQPQKTITPACFFFPVLFCKDLLFSPSRQQQRERKKGPHCSIVHIVSFFASEQRLFAAQLGTQWCSHKNEPLSSHTKLQIAKHCRGEARLSKFAYSHFPLLSSSYKTSRFC